MRKFNFTLDNGTVLTISPPTVRTYYKGFVSAKTDGQLFSAVAEICNKNDENISVDCDFVLNNFTVDDFNRFVRNFSDWINSEKNSDPN